MQTGNVVSGGHPRPMDTRLQEGGGEAAFGGPGLRVRHPNNGPAPTRRASRRKSHALSMRLTFGEGDRVVAGAGRCAAPNRLVCR